jgi:hypothetical protein
MSGGWRPGEQTQETNMSILGNSKSSNLRKRYLISVALVTVAAALTVSTQSADAAFFGRNFGGGFHSVSSFHSVGSFHGLSRSTSGLTRSTSEFRPATAGFGGTLHARTTFRPSGHTTAARHLGRTDASVAHTRVASRADEGAKITPKTDAKIVPGHAGISVDNGNGGWKPYAPGPKDPPTVAQRPQLPAGPSGISVDTGNGWQAYQPKDPGPVSHAHLDGGRDAGGDMKIRPGTERPPSFAKVYDPDNGQTVTVVDNGDGTRSVTSPVSYGSTPDAGLVRVDDLPRIKAKVQRDCRLLAAKVAQLSQQLTQQNAVLTALAGGQNVAYSATITGVSTSFASEDAQAAAVARMEAQIATTSQLLAQFINDLNRCLAGN